MLRVVLLVEDVPHSRVDEGAQIPVHGRWSWRSSAAPGLDLLETLVVDHEEASEGVAVVDDCADGLLVGALPA